MVSEKLPDEHRPRHAWWSWLGPLVVVTFVVRVGLGVVTRVVDLAFSALVLGAVAAFAWHFTIGARRRRRRP